MLDAAIALRAVGDFWIAAIAVEDAATAVIAVEEVTTALRAVLLAMIAVIAVEDAATAAIAVEEAATASISLYAEQDRPASVAMDLPTASLLPPAARQISGLLAISLQRAESLSRSSQPVNS